MISRQLDQDGIKVIVFDYDGVIVDTFRDVFEVYQIMCRELNARIIPETVEQFHELYGFGVYRDLYAKLGVRQEDVGRGSDIFKREMSLKDSKLFDGIPEVLQVLSQEYALALVSASPKDLVVATLKKYDIFNYFQVIIGKDENVTHPKKEGLEIVKKMLNVSGNEMMVIGDRNVDHEIAQEAGIRRILLVDYGWGYDKEKYPQSFSISRPLDILDAIKNMEGK